MKKNNSLLHINIRDSESQSNQKEVFCESDSLTVNHTGTKSTHFSDYLLGSDYFMCWRMKHVTFNDKILITN